MSLPGSWRHTVWSIPLLAMLLLAAGWLGIARADDLAAGSGAMLRHQWLWSGMAAAALLVTASTNYRLAYRYAYWALGACLVLLVAVFLFAPINGAHRWVRVAGIGFQPSEMAKVVVVVALARYLTYRESLDRWWGAAPPLAIAALPAWLVLREPDLGTALVFAPVALAMIFAAGARLKSVAAAMLLGLALLPLLWTAMSHDQRTRITALWEQNAPGTSPTPSGYHLHQAKRMLALGGWWGSIWTKEPSIVTPEVGDDQISDSGQETPSFSRDALAEREGGSGHERSGRTVPEPYTDSIFCVLGERFGIVGGMSLLGLYGLLIWRGLALAQRSEEPFGRLLVVGVMTMIGAQVIINTGMLVGLLPITGVPLPLVSYGGSGLVATAAALGMVVSVGARD